MILFRIARPYLLASLVFCALAPSSFAHEFWIEPEQYELGAKDTVVAQFKNGENFVGINLGYFDRRSTRFEYALDGRTTPLTPRAGNIPVLDMPAPGSGLMVIAHETTPATLKYKDWEKFQAFADHKDFPDIRARHQARGLPATEFSEHYTRHAKALIGIGDARGADRVMGLETEFVALANPYTDDMASGLPVQLLYQGAPRADAQVEVFERSPDGAVIVRLTRTDAQGRAVIAVASGHSYLIDAVVLRESPPDSSTVWETLWAALTFAVP